MLGSRDCTQRLNDTRACGFTLIELMVTIAVASILLVIALPSYRTLVLNNRQSSVVDAITSASQYARSTALTSDASILLCPDGGGGACGASWSSGWIVATVPAPPALPVPAVVLTTSKVAGTSNGVGLTVNTIGGSVSMLFNSRGLVTGADTFKVCDSRGAAYARAVELNTVGFIQSSQTPGFAPDGVTALICP